MPGTLLAFHYDLKRAMWSAELMDHYAATLAEWGYNAVLYEVEDKLRFRRHPALAHPDAISADETCARLDAVRRRGLEAIPLVQSLGHAEYVLTKPGYEHLRESPVHTAQYDPLSEAARGLVCELIDETIAAVRPERFFHLGGDETWNLGRSDACRPVVGRIGKGGLYLAHMRPIIEHVISRGLRPILWADIALAHPEIIGQFPREVVWMDWDYWTGAERWPEIRVWEAGRTLTWRDFTTVNAPGFRRYFEPYVVDDQTRRDGTFRAFPYSDALRAMGFDVIVAPATRCWGDSMGIPHNSVHLPNCRAGARKGREAGLGACVTSWAVRHSHPLVNLPGAFAAAQGFGTSESDDPVAVVRAFTEHRFGVALPEFAEALRLAEGRVPWCESREMKAPEAAAGAVQAWLAQVDGQAGGRDEVIARVEETAAGLARAEAVFADLRPRAREHADDFDYWLEGVRHTRLCATFDLALLRGRLPAEAPALRQQLAARRAETRRLFGTTFPAASTREEEAVRYAFHAAVLDSAGAPGGQPCG